MSLELAVSSIAAASGFAASAAGRAAFDQLKSMLTKKGVPKEEFEQLKKENLSAEEMLSTVDKITSHLSCAEKLDITTKSLEETQRATRHLRDERLRQAKSAFNAALVLSVVGVWLYLVALHCFFLRMRQLVDQSQHWLEL